MSLVRVRANGREFNVGAAYAEANGLEVLDEPTHRGGFARPVTRTGGRKVKPKTTVSAEAAKKAATSAEKNDDDNSPSKES